MSRGRADYYAPGDFNRICSRTGFKIKASQTKKEWNNQIVRRESWEARHPQDLLRSRPDRQQVPDPRSEATDTFLGTNDVLEIYAGQITTWLAIPEAAVTGTAIADLNAARRLITREGGNTAAGDDFLVIER